MVVTTVSSSGDTTGTTGTTGAATTGGVVGSDNPLEFEGTASGLTFSAKRGVYDAPFDVTVTHDTAAEVVYTLDGSDPRTSASSITAPLPLTLSIDPANTAQRYLAPGVVVRAMPAGATLPAAVVTHTYLFLNRVVELSPDGEAPGAQWPEPSEAGTGFGGGFQGGGGSQVMDYGIDPEIAENPDYAAFVETGLRSIPSISLVSDLQNLFDEENGIYMNAENRGVEWERFGSVELLHPDNAPGFQANTGIRIRGGYSRSSQNPKHSFRLFFRAEEYGTAKLRFAVFGKEGAIEYDRLDLRTSQNYSWSFEGDNYDENIMNRDVFSRDLQRELGRPYTRSRYYHLFLNGVYWGLYQSQERADDNYAREYFGGASDDYDVIKVDTEAGRVIEANEGTFDGWQAVWQLAEGDFESDAAYYALEGNGPDGVRDATLPVLVDVDNLIDYMLVIFYTANVDGPVTKFFENQVPNNFYAINSRVNVDQGFVFFAHDNEHTLFAEPITVVSGVDENRVNIGEPGSATDSNGEPDDDFLMDVGEFELFHPQWLHHQLSANANYRQRFGLRAQTLLTGTGPMTAAPATALFDARAAEIESAIILESARWGDAQREAPRTKNDDWLPALDRVRSGFFPQRSAIVIEQLSELGLYPQN